MHCSHIITCTTTATSSLVFVNSHVIISRWCTAATSSPARQQPRHHQSLVHCSNIITCTTTATSSSVVVGALQQDHHLHDNSHVIISRCWCAAARSSPARQQPRHHQPLVHCSNIITCTITATSSLVFVNSHVIISRWCTAASSSPAQVTSQQQQHRHLHNIDHHRYGKMVTNKTTATSLQQNHFLQNSSCKKLSSLEDSR